MEVVGIGLISPIYKNKSMCVCVFQLLLDLKLVGKVGVRKNSKQKVFEEIVKRQGISHMPAPFTKVTVNEMLGCPKAPLPNWDNRLSSMVIND